MTRHQPVESPDPETWLPDEATVRWAAGGINEDRVRTALVHTHRRLTGDAGVEAVADIDYWQSMAEAAVEAVVWSMADRTQEWSKRGKKQG